MKAQGLQDHHIPKKIQSQILSKNRRYSAYVMKAAPVNQVSGKVCDSSFMSPCSVTVRNRAPTNREGWVLSNLIKTQTFIIANIGEGLVSVLETGSKGNIYQPCYNYECRRAIAEAPKRQHGLCLQLY